MAEGSRIEFDNEGHPDLAAAVDRMLRIFNEPDETFDEVRVSERDELGRAVAFRKRKVNTWRPATIEHALRPVLAAAIAMGEYTFADEVAEIIGEQWQLTPEAFHAEVAKLAARAERTTRDDNEEEEDQQ